MRKTTMTKFKNNERGITLIALVITIIVLLLLAGVAISMLSGENGLLNQAANAKTRTGEVSELERVELAVLSALTAGVGKVDLTNDSEEANSIHKALKEEFGNDSKKPTYEEGKITLSNGETYNVTTSGSIEKESEEVSGEQWTLPEGDTVVDVGDLLTPTVEGLENEQFYVIADDGTTLTLLAKTCINTSTYVQVDRGYSSSPFDSEATVYANSSIRGVVENYVDTLNELTLLDVEEVYGGSAVAEMKGRLMWYEEADPGRSPFKDAENYSDILYGPEGARMNYWLGNRLDENAVWYVSEGCSLEFCTSDTELGVRPVIKISKSSIK